MNKTHLSYMTKVMVIVENSDLTKKSKNSCLFIFFIFYSFCCKIYRRAEIKKKIIPHIKALCTHLSRTTQYIIIFNYFFD